MLWYLVSMLRRGCPGDCDDQGFWVVGTRVGSVDDCRDVVHSAHGPRLRVEALSTSFFSACLAVTCACRA